MFNRFISIFLSKLPDRLACLILIISIFSLGSFAYQTVGLPIQMASAEGTPTGDSAVGSATAWAYMQNCFGDRIEPDTLSSSASPAGDGTYHVTLDFTSLEYRVDPGTGGLHHIPANHTVELLISHGKVVSAFEGMRDLIDDPAYRSITGIDREPS